MIQLFFSVLVLIIFIGLGLYALFYDKKSLAFIAGLAVLSLLLINMFPWWLCSVSFLLLAIPIIKKEPAFGKLASLCMFGTAIAAYFLFLLFLKKDIQIITMLSILTVTLICILGIFGILENNIKRFLLYSNSAQLTFVFLDLGVAKLSSKIATLGIIQIFNYVFAGTLLFTTLGILSKARNTSAQRLNQLRGYYYKDSHSSISAIIAAASLAGLPGLNIFVSEWLLFKTAFIVEPTITIFGIFAALILFLMYFKIVYYLLSGKAEKKKKPALLPAIFNFVLAALCLLLGILPFLQFSILEAVL